MTAASVVVSAPSKAILFGEHSVVYGRQALVASLDRRLTMTLVRRPDLGPADPALTLHVPDLAPEALRLDRGDLEEFAPGDSAVARQWLAAKLGDSVPASARDACGALLVVMTTAGWPPGDAVKVSVESAIPVGAGLGSSAALSVAAAAGLLVLAGRLSADSGAWTEAQREQISTLAFAGERLLHGTPSGLDNAIVTFGGLVAFSRGAGVRRLGAAGRPLLLLVADTRVPRSTGQLVGAVRARWEAERERFERLFDAIEAVVLQATAQLAAGGPAVEVERRLDALVTENQRLLREIGVSHPAVEAAVGAVAGFGLAAKLTGAGGGGCVVAVVPAEFGRLDDLIAGLSGRGFPAWTARLGAEGVRVEGSATG